MGFLLYAFIGCILFMSVYNSYPAAVTTICVAAVSLFVYQLVINSQWLDRQRRQNKANAAASSAEAEAKKKDRVETDAQAKKTAEWAVYTPPDFSQFMRDVDCPKYFAAYAAHSSIAVACLYTSKEYLQPHYTVAQYQSAYSELVRLTQSALNRYTAALPHEFRAPQVESPFTIAITPTDELVADANRALADGFRHNSEYIMQPQRAYNCFSKPREPSKPSRHRSDEDYREEMREYKEEMRAYEKERKEWENAEDELFDEQTVTQKAFWNTPFYPLADHFIPEPFKIGFELPYKERFAGTWIIAPSGQGKTNLMWHLIEADRKRRGTIVIMDSKGALLNPYRGYGDAVLIDAKTARINPFQIGRGDQAIDFIEYIFSLIAVGMTPKQQSLFYPVLRLVTKVPNGSLDTFKKILILGWRELNLGAYIQRCDTNTREFFTLGNPASFDDQKYKETKQELIWRFDLFLSKPAMQQIFSTSQSNIDFFELLDSGKIILVNNSVNDLGVGGSEFFGRFFLALTWMAAVGRTEIPDEKKVPVFFYIDEAQTVIANDAKVPVILDECRSQMIALTVGHQRLNRITSTEVKDALFNCPVRFASVDHDAPQIAHRFGKSTPEELQLSAHTFACYIRYENPRHKMDKAAIIDISFFDKNTFPPYEAPFPPDPDVEPEPDFELPPEPPKKKQKAFKKDRKRTVPNEGVEDF